ncbi:hypothetical protein QYE76_026748 [Lolium multiflorum]|uniref:Zinc knuckle CX2CX4HX4C domain-containing protein n=1 Tax=Lolium multiflorum TaxID=4521 RepID=A0AAD8VX76_LOLMU|nr:hypothetical protein QYE76_026748 [Lolium multiflorum]
MKRPPGDDSPPAGYRRRSPESPEMGLAAAPLGKVFRIVALSGFSTKTICRQKGRLEWEMLCKPFSLPEVVMLQFATEHTAVVLLKDYAGSVRPSDMVFDTMDVWIVLDVPMDMMNMLYGRLIGDWVGKYISVEVDQDGIAWGKELRIRLEVRADHPLPRGVSMKEKDDDKEGTWFDLKYEKIPHFCFDCGCIVHPPDGSPAENSEWKQWGEWLRASPRINQKPSVPARSSVSSGSYGSYSPESDSRGRGGATIRDLPPRRNLTRDDAYSGSSCTSGG